MSLERQLNKKSTLTVSYGGYRGWHSLLSIDVNAPLPPAYNPLLRPDPAHGQILQQQSGGYQKSDSLVVSWRGRFWEHFSGMTQLQLGNTPNSNNSPFPPFAQPRRIQFDPNAEWSRAIRLGTSVSGCTLLGTFYPGEDLLTTSRDRILSANTPEPYTITTGNG